MKFMTLQKDFRVYWVGRGGQKKKNLFWPKHLKRVNGIKVTERCIQKMFVMVYYSG